MYDGLFPKHVQDSLPPFRTGDDEIEYEDLTAQVKFFIPVGLGTWWAAEYDEETRTFFGMADLGYRELGYFSLDELENYSGPLGLGIERDIHFEPVAMVEIMQGG